MSEQSIKFKERWRSSFLSLHHDLSPSLKARYRAEHRKVDRWLFCLLAVHWLALVFTIIQGNETDVEVLIGGSLIMFGATLLFYSASGSVICRSLNGVFLMSLITLLSCQLSEARELHAYAFIALGYLTRYKDPFALWMGVLTIVIGAFSFSGSDLAGSYTLSEMTTPQPFPYGKVSGLLAMITGVGLTLLISEVSTRFHQSMLLSLGLKEVTRTLQFDLRVNTQSSQWANRPSTEQCDQNYDEQEWQAQIEHTNGVVDFNRLMRALSTAMADMMSRLEAISKGEPLPPLKAQLGGEVGLLVQKLHQLEEVLENRDELKSHRQNQLIHREKMVALGYLIAGVAHEVNTPLGAIKASGEAIASQLGKSVFERQAIELLHRLKPQQRNAFFELLVLSPDEQVILMPSREQRRLRRSVQDTLEAKGVRRAQSLSEDIVMSGMHHHLDKMMIILLHEEGNALFELLYTLISQRRQINNILSAVQRASKMVTALKHYAHGKEESTRAAVQLTDEINTVLTLNQHAISRGIEVIREFEDDLPFVYADVHQLNQVWQNLIHNAIQAMEGCGTLIVSLRKEKGGVMVHIQDSGHGIPSEHLELIFEAFFTTKPVGEGTGLGLDICQHIIEEHHGEIDVVSQPGKTIFSTWLPAYQASLPVR